jgi:hypothetical protein
MSTPSSSLDFVYASAQQPLRLKSEAAVMRLLILGHPTPWKCCSFWLQLGTGRRIYHRMGRRVLRRKLPQLEPIPADRRSTGLRRSLSPPGNRFPAKKDVLVPNHSTTIGFVRAVTSSVVPIQFVDRNTRCRFHALGNTVTTGPAAARDRNNCQL